MRSTAPRRRTARTPYRSATTRSRCCSRRDRTSTACSSPIRARASTSTTSASCILWPMAPSRDQAPATASEAADPRVTHVLTLVVDPFGNVLQSASALRPALPRPVAGARRPGDAGHTLSTYLENNYTNAMESDDAHRTPLPAQTALRAAPGSARRRASGLHQPVRLRRDGTRWPAWRRPARHPLRGPRSRRPRRRARPTGG